MGTEFVRPRSETRGERGRKALVRHTRNSKYTAHRHPDRHRQRSHPRAARHSRIHHVAHIIEPDDGQSLCTQNSSSVCHSRLVRASRDASMLKTAPTCPSHTADNRRSIVQLGHVPKQDSVSEACSAKQ